VVAAPASALAKNIAALAAAVGPGEAAPAEKPGRKVRVAP